MHICTSCRLIKWKLHSFCIPFVVRRRSRRRPSLELSPLGVARPTETTAHKIIRLTERELNGIAINFPSTIAENFRAFIDKLHNNYCRRVNHVFKGNTVTDRDSTRRANCAKQVADYRPPAVNSSEFLVLV